MYQPTAARPSASLLYPERDRHRSYSINLKMVVLACATELIIAAASLIGAFIFAQIHGHDDLRIITMIMLAPAGYAAVEMSRVPSAIAARTQASVLLRLLAIVGVVCAAGVTIKSISQLGEIMFRPRLMQVVHVRERSDDA